MAIADGHHTRPLHMTIADAKCRRMLTVDGTYADGTRFGRQRLSGNRSCEEMHVWQLVHGKGSDCEDET